MSEVPLQVSVTAQGETVVTTQHGEHIEPRESHLGSALASNAPECASEPRTPNPDFLLPDYSRAQS